MSCSYGYYSEKIRKAKKEHKCCECHDKININDKYADCRWGGGDFDFSDGAKQHVYCWHIARLANYGTSALSVRWQDWQKLKGFMHDIGDGECVEFGGLEEEFSMSRDDDHYVQVNRMWQGIKSGVKEQFDFGGGV